MPMKDDEEPFVAAMVSARGKHIDIGIPNGRSKWLCEKLLQFSASPFYTFIKPANGYGQAITEKLTKMDVMAQITRQRSGANAAFLAKDSGARLRNMVWVHSMYSALQKPMLYAVIDGPVTAIEVYLDQKTLVKETRNLCRAAMNALVPNLRSSIALVAQAAPQSARSLLRNVQFDSISVKWSNEAGTNEANSGLALAHYLASLTRRDLLKGQNVLANALRESGFRNFSEDVTGYASQPISEEAVSEWETTNGLQRP